MNREDALALFHRHDDPVRWECPEHFDRRSANSRFKAFAAALDQATGLVHAVETESYIQDASFHSQIALGSSWLRFSNFGDMVAITPDHVLDEPTLAIVQGLCRGMGYAFVPTEFAELPYDGKNPGVTGIRNWWIRYFDWV